MTISVTVYKPKNGEIQRGLSVSSLAELRLNIQTGEKYISGIYPSSDYYVSDKGEPKLRPQIEVPKAETLSVGDELSLPAVPKGTEMWFRGDRVAIADDDGLALVFEIVTSGAVLFQPPFPYKAASMMVEVE